MSGKKLKKFRMAVGICGPQILYTNIIKAYTAEEAARKYYEEIEEEASDEKITETACKMQEIQDEKPLKAYYDCRKELFGVDDSVFVILKKDRNHSYICKSVVTALTNRGVKVLYNDKEYSVLVGRNDYFDLDGENVPYFAKVLKITEEMDPEGELETGSQVAFMEKEYMGNSHGFLFGTVDRISEKYVFINSEKTVIKKIPAKIQKIS